jgi:hypothetical protein
MDRVYAVPSLTQKMRIDYTIGSALNAPTFQKFAGFPSALGIMPPALPAMDFEATLKNQN